MSNRKAIPAIVLSIFTLMQPGQGAAQSTQLELDGRFNNTVRPFLQSYCISCHSGDKPKGQFDLSSFTTMERVTKASRQWETVLEVLSAGDMPPVSATSQPTAEQRKAIIGWLEATASFEARRNAGDPGTVLARRLSNAEYDYTIRDLTGVDIRPTREFPVDPANEAGFDNSGESLAMSPSLVKKYLDAASTVADHVVLKPDGFTFGPYPMVAETDRDKYAVNRIVEFYRRQPTDIAEYFRAAWRFKNRQSLNLPQASLNDFAAQAKLSPNYLEKVWSVVSGKPEQIGPIAAVQIMWSKLPAPAEQKETEDLLAACRKMRDFIADLRPWVTPQIENFPTRGLAAGSQSLVLWKDRKIAASHLAYADNALQVNMTAYANTHPEMLIPESEDARKAYDASFKRFCEVFPDRFLVAERGRIFSNDQGEQEAGGRLLSAGFHSQMGYFRDDQPLYDLILDPQQRHELDEMWRELDFITLAPIRQHQQFIWFERAEPPGLMLSAEFNSFRSEDANITSEQRIKDLAEAYIARARTAGASDEAIEVVADHFKRINQTIRGVEQSRLAAEPRHLATLLEFAAHAYRRPLSQPEKDELLEFYRTMRKEGSDHEVAIRDSIVSVLMSPDFLYRVNASEARDEIRPLSGYALASRLSYFLWSSMPDKELLAHAASGDLNRPEVMIAQTKRMLQDERVRGLATEFGANWLDIRRFEEHNAVDRERFPTFTNELREAMFQEPIEFFTDLIKHDRSLLDFLYADYALVNPILARHYGMPEIKGDPQTWVRVDGVSKYDRGGLLPMSVFLTKNAPGLRTSPVKRGYWVVNRILGEQIPSPPPDVPVLPSDESKLGDLTLRQALAKHREDKSCATCHQRFDSFGLVFEGFGPIGEVRTKDLGNRPVETTATFPDGSEATGLKGLRNYIRDHREEDFLDNFCKKMLVFALGRSLVPSDSLLIADMRAKLKPDGNRFSDVVESIVTSPQFLNMRSAAQVARE